MTETLADDAFGVADGGHRPGAGARPRWWPFRRRGAEHRPDADGRPWADDGLDEELPGLPPFRPTPVDSGAQRRWVVQQIGELPPHSVDDQHGHLLDAPIDDKTAQWVARVKRDLADYSGRLLQLRGRVNAEVLHEQHLEKEHEQRVSETLFARTAAASRLSGEDDEGQWAQPGHSDPTALSGLSGVSWLYLVALLFAAVADLIAFYQVLSLVLGNLPDMALSLLVLGFTAIALMLADRLGVFLRDSRAGARWHHPVMLPAAAVLWIALGLVAFWVRWKIGGDAAANSPAASGTVQVQETGGDFQGTLPGATLFAVFYFASGMVAITGSYFNHNPLRRSFVKAVRAHNAAIRQQADGAYAVAEAQAECEAIDHQEKAAAQVCELAIEELRHLAGELKRLSRQELIKKIREASGTDSLLDG